MPKIFYDKDANLAVLQGKKIAIIGYGSQGHAHALNLRDSGLNVVVGLHEGSASRAKAQAAGLNVTHVAEAAESADTIMMLTPDVSQKAIYEEAVSKGLRPGKTLMFAHGFNIHYQTISPPKDVDVTMVAPKSPGHRLRELFTEGVGVPALLAVAQDASGNAYGNALAYAKGIGCTRAGVIETTFKEETESDLFGEQVALCGGISFLIKTAFETLVEAGYQPEIAYFECLHEMKLIVDLIYQGGLGYMRYSVSDTAEYGDYTRGPRIVSESVRGEMKKVLAEIQDGSFAREWIQENQQGRKKFDAMRAAEKSHQIEQVGESLRKLMSHQQTAKAQNK